MKITTVIVGYGDRGSIYANYASQYPDELKIVAVVDPDPYKLNLAKEKFGTDGTQYLADFNELLKLGKIADCAVIATMDQLHYEQATALLKLDYHLLLEKPVVNNVEQLEEIRNLAVLKNRTLMVGHVLRYTPFYGAIKREILSGKIGQIIHIETSELVGIAHSSSSYIRGKWKNENECGSSMLLAKCCHDLDLICWLNNLSEPEKIVSFGGRNFIVPEKAPASSTQRCYDGCPHIDECKFSAKSLYVNNDMFPSYSYPTIKKPHDQISEEEKINALKTNDPMGVCAYKTGSDLVDHQGVMIKFENGSTAFHSMIAAVPRPGRKIHIIGTEGEIEGFFESNVYHVRKFNPENSWYTEESVNVEKDIEAGVGHGGGDICLMRDFVRIIRGEEASVAVTSISDSINGHNCVYLSDFSLRDGEIKKIKF